MDWFNLLWFVSGFIAICLFAYMSSDEETDDITLDQALMLGVFCIVGIGLGLFSLFYVFCFTVIKMFEKYRKVVVWRRKKK